MLLATNLLFLGVPLYSGRAIDLLKAGNGLDGMPTLVAFIVGFAILTAVTRIGSRIYIFNAARAAEYSLRSDLFHHLLNLDPSYFRTHATGDVMSRLTNDVQTVRAMWGAGVLQLVNTGVAYLSVIIVMMRIDPILTLWAMVPYPTLYVVGKIMGKRVFKFSRGVQAQLGALSSDLQEDLGGIHLIKTYGLEDDRRKRFLQSSLKLLDQNMALTRVRGQMAPLLGALSAIGTVIVIWIGAKAHFDHNRISIGDISAFLGLVASLVWPTLALGWMLSLLERGKASWSRLQTVLETKSTMLAGTSELPASAANAGHISVKNLTISIGDRRLLDDVSFDLAPGSSTAIVGRTGGGKSTLVDALARLIDVNAGCIFLDGVDVTELPIATARAAIGYAPQEAFLFSTTIADNIAMGYGGGTSLPRARSLELESIGAAPQATAAARDVFIDGKVAPRILAAASAAGLDRDLAIMPEGFATVVGERGITLSGGQRQRVALARAIARQPRVLILDDSLSSVDAETEHVILGHLRAVMKGRTSVLISHRVAAVKRADQIIVVDAGRIVECGKHADLLAAGGLYAELYRSQFDPDEMIDRAKIEGIEEREQIAAGAS